MGRIQAVLLDAGDTLFTEATSREEIYRDVAASFGLDLDAGRARDSMRSALRDLPVVVNEHFRFTQGWFREFIQRVFADQGFAALPTDLPPRLFEEFSRARTFRVFDDVLPSLQELKGSGLVVGVVSNWTPALPRLLDALGIGAHLDFTLCSAVEKVEKPHPEIFHRALALAGVAAEAAMHVGDSQNNDVKGSRAVGLRAVLLDRTYAGDPPVNGEVLSSLSDLPALSRAGENDRTL